MIFRVGFMTQSSGKEVARPTKEPRAIGEKEDQQDALVGQGIGGVRVEGSRATPIVGQSEGRRKVGAAYILTVHPRALFISLGRTYVQSPSWSGIARPT